MKLDKSCGNCRYGQQWGGSLRCRRFPPTVDFRPREDKSLWPQVNFEWVCGEFRAMPQQHFDFNTEEPV